MEAPDGEGITRLYGFTSFGQPAGTIYVIAGVPLDAAFADVNRTTGQHVLWLMIVLGVILLWVRMASEVLILRAVNVLVSTVKLVKGGDLSARVGKPYVRGELGQLSHDFDEMAEALQERDAESRKIAAELRASEEKYRELIRYAPAGIYEIDFETDRFASVNDVMCEYTGYTRDELLTMNFSNILTEESWGLMQRHLKAGVKIDTVTEYSIRTKKGNELWALINAGYTYEAGRLKGATGVVYTITERKRVEEEKKESIEKLRKALGSTVHAMAMITETRDPYTSGHQRRVAGLARAIATEIGLSSSQIDGLRMAATIHDLGKISVPAEILSKPGILTDIERRLVKTHSQAGYDILKDIEFIWPIARMILEHHERLNGSGYPNGLSGDRLLIESRILAIADVVESMASHRPYRPALGINAALEEIETNKGILYDSEAVDACLRLFNQKGYVMEG